MPDKYDELIRRSDLIALAEAKGFLSVDDILSIETVARKRKRIARKGGKKTVEISIRGTVFLSVKAAADALGVSVHTVKSAKRLGRLDTVGFGQGYKSDEAKKKLYGLRRREIHFMGCVFNGWEEAKHITGKSRGYMMSHGAVVK